MTSVLKGDKMDNPVKMKYIEVKQPIGSFYIGKLKYDDLLDIASADIRKIDNESSNKTGFDSYLGIQRELSPSRIKEISEYVKTEDATFPTSIILSLKSTIQVENGNEINDITFENLENTQTIKNINIDEDNGLIEIRRDKNVASILDGQHRVEGLERGLAQGRLDKDFEFNVTLFVDMDIDDQAQVFSVINKAQTKVNKSLVYDLYEYAKSSSPQKTAHDIVRLLNSLDNSPFKKKVKILGIANDKERETISQATLAESIINFISSDPMKDRDRIRRKRNTRRNKIGLEFKDSDKNKRIFREYFINEQDERILHILVEYFSAIKMKWPNAWDMKIDGSILPKSTGIIAFMRLLKDIVNNNSFSWESNFQFYLDIIDKSTLKDRSFTKDDYMPGTSGQSKLYKILYEECISN